MVRPLTKRKKDGKLYVRPNAVEEQIAGAMREDRETLRRRIRMHQRDSPRYLRTECLVYLLREASRNGDEQLVNASVEGILVRCGRMLWTMVSGSLPEAEEIRARVLHEVSVVLARDTAGAGVAGDRLAPDGQRAQCVRPVPEAFLLHPRARVED